MNHRALAGRFLVWSLAAMSFACLLGEFYNLWSMRPFACWVLLPSTALLAFLWRRKYLQGFGGFDVSRAIACGALGGVLAALVYDLFRLPFVLSGYPLFKVFPLFGQMLLGASEPRWLVETLGWAYHFSNGAALGIMFAAMLPTGWLAKKIIAAGAVWACVVEAILLLTPYRDFFKIHMPFVTFLVLTGSAHLLFGLVLGWYFSRSQLQVLAGGGSGK
jgi:hypothetical protein